MSAADELILYCDARFCSPWVLTVWTSLKEKKVPFRPVMLNLEHSENQAGDFPPHTLARKVPSMRLGDFWMSESLAIQEYLEERFPAPAYNPLLPAEMEARAEDRAIRTWLRTDLMELCRCLPFEGIFLKMETPEPTPQCLTEAEALLHVAYTRLAHGSAAPLTFADFELAFSIRRLIHYRVRLEGQDEVVAWSDSIWNRPSMQSWARQNRGAFGEPM